MFIRGYLRSSTETQYAVQAEEMLELFVQEGEHLLGGRQRNDILLVEKTDRLPRLSNSGWITLK